MADDDPPPGQPSQPNARQMGTPPQGTPPTGATPPPRQPRAGNPGRLEPVAGLSVSTPTLYRVSVSHPQEPEPLGENDYVLDSVYNPSTDAWEVLVLVRPPEETEDDE